MILKDSSCVKCGSKWVENKTHSLCHDCNYFRLHKETEREAKIRKDIQNVVKVYKIKPQRIKSSLKTVDKRKETLLKDRETYYKVFVDKPCECEECGRELPSEFEDEIGNINSIWQYSHILSKGAFPEYRHSVWNFQKLCMDCHQVYEFGDRLKMKTYFHTKLIVFAKTGKYLLK